MIKVLTVTCIMSCVNYSGMNINYTVIVILLLIYCIDFFPKKYQTLSILLFSGTKKTRIGEISHVIGTFSIL